MKPTTLLAITVLSASLVQAQNRPTNATNNRIPNAAYSRNDSLTTIARGLADVAIENMGSGADATAEALKYDYLATKTAWADRLVVAGNLNEFTIKGRNSFSPPYGNSLVYPRYNIGVTIPIGIFTNQPKQTKAAYYRYQAEVENVKRAKESYRLQVMNSYFNYTKNLQLLSLQEEALQDAEFEYTKTEDKFSKGQTTLEAYSAAGKRFNTEKVNKATLESDTRAAKAELESLLGMPYETAIARIGKSRR
jgi:outer membrane protein TolC